MKTALDTKRAKNRVNSITLCYDSNNDAALRTLEYIIDMGYFYIQNKKKLSPIEEGLDDIRNGRVTTINNPNNLILECQNS
jgi:hypothetical protein